MEIRQLLTRKREAGVLTEIEKLTPGQFQVHAVQKIRDDSRRSVKPTRADQLTEIALDMGLEDVRSSLNLLDDSEKYQDIKSVSPFPGAKYFFSEKYMTLDLAEKLARIEEFQIRVTGKVREDSRDGKKPTRMFSLATLIPGVTRTEIEAGIAELLKKDKYHDIKQASAFTGATFLYSDKYLTPDFTTKLIKAEESKSSINKGRLQISGEAD